METLITENGIKITAQKKFTVNFFPEQLEVTPEQLRSCVRVMPLESLKYYSEEELAGKQLDYCKEATK